MGHHLQLLLRVTGETLKVPMQQRPKCPSHNPSFGRTCCNQSRHSLCHLRRNMLCSTSETKPQSVRREEVESIYKHFDFDVMCRVTIPFACACPCICSQVFL